MYTQNSKSQVHNKITQAGILSLQSHMYRRLSIDGQHIQGVFKVQLVEREKVVDIPKITLKFRIFNYI